MASEIVLDLDNHLIKCRMCLREFEMDDTQIKITKIVEIRFEELTNLVLRNTENYSNVICENCNNNLKTFSIFRKDTLLKQTSLYSFVEGNDCIYEENIKDCDQEEEIYEYKIDETNSEEVKPETDDAFDNCIRTEYFVVPEDNPEDDDDAEIIEERLDEDIYQKIDSIRTPACKKRTVKETKKVYKRAQCNLCGNSYYKDQLQRHIDKVHLKVKKYFCDLCGFGAFLKCNLATHMAKHIAKEHREQILCKLCPAVFTRIESLKNHMKTEHGQNVEILRCFCGKEFNLRHKLTTHIKRTHNNERDHHCSQCTKKFFTPKELQLHILKIHTPGYIEKSEHYCETCGKKMSSAKSLKTHMKHHSEPEFKCPFEGCMKGFITKLLLRNHEKIHLGQRDHMCHFCEKSFFSANHLRRHIAVSHTKVRMNCFVEGCKFSVGRKDYLRNHIITHRELSEDVKNEYLLQIRNMKII